MNIDKADGLGSRTGPTSIAADSSPRRVAGDDGAARPAAQGAIAESPLTLSPGLQAILASAQGEPAAQVDQARVEGIRQAISNGTYHVNPDRLAEHFLELETIIDQ